MFITVSLEIKRRRPDTFHDESHSTLINGNNVLPLLIRTSFEKKITGSIVQFLSCLSLISNMILKYFIVWVHISLGGL